MGSAETFIQLVMSLLLVAAMVSLTFVVFRVSIRNNHRQIAIIALIVGVTNFYFKFILQEPFFMLVQTFVFMVMLMVLRKYPILYALIMSVAGSLFVTVIDIILSVIALRTGWSTMELMTTSLKHFVIMHLLTTGAIVLVAIILFRLNAGFSFVVRRFIGKSLRLADLLWGVILIATLTILQFSAMKLDVFSLHGVILTLLSIGLIGVLWHAYIQNLKVKKDRFGGGK